MTAASERRGKGDEKKANGREELDMLDVQSAKLFVPLVVEIQQPLAPISLEFMCLLPVLR